MMILIMVCFFSTTVFAAAPTTIKIGLESVYKDTASIYLAGDRYLNIGYFENGYFEEQGRLNTAGITIEKTGGDYYFTGDVYRSFEEAEERANLYGNGAVPAYIEPSTYCVYTPNYQGGLLTAPSSASRIGVYNERRELILVSDNNYVPLSFQGAAGGDGFPLTQIGNTRKYRGAVSIVNGPTGGLTAVNELRIEEYLYGVVPAEVAPTWPMEALKAQAVAARSIASVQYNRYINKGYNVVDTTASQVYKGFSIEHPNTNLAVDATSGEMIKYNNQVAEALYFSTSGGATEDAKYVWGNEVSYLKAVQDTYETEPAQGPWVRNITLNELNNCLINKGINIGNLEGVEIAERTPSGRVQIMILIGTRSSYTVSNEEVRTFFSGTNEGSLKSRLFSFSGFLGTPAVGQAGSGLISVMSGEDMLQKDMSTLKVLSAEGIIRAPNDVTMQSAKDKTEFRADTGRSTVQNTSLQSESVFGDLTIYGQGFGHGVGMSQSGAKGMAKAGYRYDEILKHYYSGITVER
jgi:stage II sporulation protein D